MHYFFYNWATNYPTPNLTQFPHSGVGMSGLKSPMMMDKRPLKFPKIQNQTKRNQMTLWYGCWGRRNGQDKKKTLADHDLFRSESPFKQLGYMLYYVVIIQSNQSLHKSIPWISYHFPPVKYLWCIMINCAWWYLNKIKYWEDIVCEWT